jgi:hypothetical protein
MEERFLVFAGIIAVGAIVFSVFLGRGDRKNSTMKQRVRRGTGGALLGLQQFIEPSVEHIFQAQNVEQKDDEEDDGLGVDEEAIRSSLAEALGRSPVDPEEVRRHLSVAARSGMDWKSLFEQAVADELRARPYRSPSLPPARRVAPHK